VSRLVELKGEVFSGYLAKGDVLFPDARACIARMAARYRLGIASGALKDEIRHILSAADLIQYFPVIVASEDVSACKPNPEPYLTAARQLGALPAECLAIEDAWRSKTRLPASKRREPQACARSGSRPPWLAINSRLIGSSIDWAK
jgi:phosphoglycolate phosphatase-like HAD superfamily hydrolase